MYIGFSTDRKTLEFLVEEEIDCCKKLTGRKRKILGSFLVAGGLLFSSMEASAELPDFNSMPYERVNFNRGSFIAPPINMETMCRKLSQEYSEYQQNFNSPPLSKRFDTIKFSQTRFRELAKDPRAKSTVFHKTTVDEARSALQAEIMGLLKDVERISQPYCKFVDIDFKIKGPSPYTHLDVKHPVGTRILLKQNSPYTLQEIALNMGRSIMKQKQRFCGLDQGPRSSRNVLHLVDLCYVPSHEKQIVKDFCLKEAGCSEGILFINDK